MSEAMPHVEQCPTCGHVNVNLTGPFPTRTRPLPSDLDRISETVFAIPAGPLQPKFTGATIVARFDSQGNLDLSSTSMRLYYEDTTEEIQHG